MFHGFERERKQQEEKESRREVGEEKKVEFLKIKGNFYDAPNLLMHISSIH